MRNPSQLGVTRRSELLSRPVAVRVCVACASPALPQGLGWVCALCGYAFVCAPMSSADLLTADNGPTGTTALSFLVNTELPSSRDGLQEIVAKLVTASAGGSRYGDV